MGSLSSPHIFLENAGQFMKMARFLTAIGEEMPSGGQKPTCIDRQFADLETLLKDK